MNLIKFCQNYALIELPNEESEAVDSENEKRYFFE